MKMLPDYHPQKCSARVFDAWHSHKCERTASIVHDGKPYCKQQTVIGGSHDAEVAYRAARKTLIAAAKLAIEDERVPTALTDAVSVFEAAEAECREAGIEIWRLY